MEREPIHALEDAASADKKHESAEFRQVSARNLIAMLLGPRRRFHAVGRGSLKESMDEFRFRELAEHMEKRDFASFVRAETV